MNAKVYIITLAIVRRLDYTEAKGGMAVKIKKLVMVLTGVLAILILCAVAVTVAMGNMEFGFARPVSEEEQALRLGYIREAESWLGTVGGSDAHGQILEVYNTHTPLAQDYAVQPTDAWCATFVSAMAIRCGLTDRIPTECGCQRQIGLWQALGRWEEDDGYIPLPGDIIYYCTDDLSVTGDCTGWSDHVGIVVGTRGNYIKVIEGNRNNAVAYRYIAVDAPTIRGYGMPDYTS